MLGTREATSEWCTETTGARSGCSVLSWARLFFQGGNQYCGVGFRCCKLVTNLPVCLEKWAALICSKSTEKLVAFPYSPTLNSYFPKSTAARILSNSYWCLLQQQVPKLTLKVATSLLAKWSCSSWVCSGSSGKMECISSLLCTLFLHQISITVINLYR